MFKRLIKKFPIDFFILVLAFYDANVVLNLFYNTVVAYQLPGDNFSFFSLFKVDSDREVLLVFLNLINDISFRGERKNFHRQISTLDFHDFFKSVV